MGWDVDIENLELIVIAPDTGLKNTSIYASILQEAKRLNCKVETVHLNSDWVDNENISVKGISGIL